MPSRVCLARARLGEDNGGHKKQTCWDSRPSFLCSTASQSTAVAGGRGGRRSGVLEEVAGWGSGRGDSKNGQGWGWVAGSGRHAYTSGAALARHAETRRKSRGCWLPTPAQVCQQRSKCVFSRRSRPAGSAGAECNVNQATTADEGQPCRENAGSHGDNRAATLAHSTFDYIYATF